MIRRIVEYVAADRALADACMDDLADGVVGDSPRWQAANDRATDAETALTAWLVRPADVLAAWWNKPAWINVFDLQEQTVEGAK